MSNPTANDPAELFRHVCAEKTVFYRRIMDVFAAAEEAVSASLLKDLRQV